MAAVFQALRQLGAVGLFLLGIADSSFLFVPIGNDLLLISLVASEREGWTWVLYVVVASLGSTAGAAIVDVVMRKVGEEGLEHFVGASTLRRVRRRVESRAGLAVFAATLAPPPFPFTAVVMTASALQTPRRTILGAVFVGRLIRFTIEALLAIRFGERILTYLKSDAVEYVGWAFIAVVVVGTAFTLRKLMRGRRSWSDRSAAHAG